MNIYQPAFIPLYLLLVVFVFWWASSLALNELTGPATLEQGTAATTVTSKFSWPGILVVVCGFAVVQYVEYSKRYQYKPFSRADVSKHNSMATGVWLIVGNDVYDVTDFVKKHPAGQKIILQNAGKDATKHYNYHLEATKHFWRRAKIGWLVDDEHV